LFRLISQDIAVDEKRIRFFLTSKPPDDLESGIVLPVPVAITSRISSRRALSLARLIAIGW
jgi:hypothetical protein